MNTTRLYKQQCRILLSPFMRTKTNIYPKMLRLKYAYLSSLVINIWIKYLISNLRDIFIHKNILCKVYCNCNVKIYCCIAHYWVYLYYMIKWTNCKIWFFCPRNISNSFMLFKLQSCNLHFWSGYLGICAK